MTILSAMGMAAISIVVMVLFLVILVLLSNLAQRIFGEESGCGCLVYLLGFLFVLVTFGFYISG